METVPGSVCPPEFLTHFNLSYPLQSTSWTNVQPPSDLWSNVIATLRGQRLPLQRWTMKPGKKVSPIGQAMLEHTMLIPGKHSQQEYLLAFAARVRTGIFGRAVQVGYQSVEKALRHVAQTLVLAGYDDPRKTLGSEHLDLPFQRLLRSYRHDNPVPKPQLALPVNTIEAAGIQ